MPSSMSSRLAKPSSYIRMAALTYPMSRKLTMKPDRPPRMLHLARQLGDRDGRGVRRDHVARAHQLVELPDQRHLQINDLRDRLDHDVRARDVLQIRAERDPGP